MTAAVDARSKTAEIIRLSQSVGLLRRQIDAARDLHQPSALGAGEYEDGTCAYCCADGSQAGESPLARFRGYLNDARSKCWMHTHTDPYPTCVTCAAGYDDRQAFPCGTAVALGWLDGGYLSGDR